MQITTVIIISLLLANLALTLIMFWIIHDLLSAVKSLQDTEEVSLKAFDMCTNQMKNNNDILKTTGEKYDHMMHAYELMRARYDTINNTYDKLLECWKSIEERYSQSYEQFKHCSDKLKEISSQITDLANVSTEDEYTLTLNEACDTVCLDCPYEQCKKDLKYEDKMLDCPVWKIKSRQREIEAELEEAAEFERQKAHNEKE